ncbi:MAG: VWA domain-containing protein [Sulfurimonas sp.]|nr:VWA domain-containing protein [Sulfurimonas sp.]
MSFLHPEFLYYMMPVLFVLFALLLTQKDVQAVFFSEEVMDKLRVNAKSLSIRTRNALFFLIGFLMIVALAQPVINDGKVLVKAKSSDIMIAFDISDSMLAQDVYPNRLELAKKKALVFLKHTLKQRVGLMAFAKNSYLVSPLSFDAKAVSFLLTQLDTTSITEKGTDFHSILKTYSLSSKSKEQKYLLILSDGGDGDDFSDEISFAKENNIVVFVLAIGTSKGAPIKLKDGNFITYNGEVLISKLNDNISALATKTGGVYIENTTSNRDILRMLKEIKSTSNSKELKSEEIHKYTALFYYPLAMALLLLLIATSSINKKTASSSASLFMLFFILTSIDARAGLLDFMQLKDARNAYEAGEYKKSEKIYKEYAQKNKNPESFFNAGNSLYKQKKYKEAISSYEKASFDSKESRAKNYSNIGNAYALDKNFQKAVESYEKSLKIKEDKDTRENLEEVKKLIKKEKEKDKQKEKKDKKNKDKDKDKKKQKDSNKDNKDKDKDKKSQDKKNKDEKNKEKNKDKNSKDSKDTDKEKKKKDENSSTSKDSKENNTTKQKKKKLDKLEKDKKDDKSASKPQNISKSKMSDAEEKKWLNEINLHKSTYLYKLNKEKPNEAKHDEKPW